MKPSESSLKAYTDFHWGYAPKHAEHRTSPGGYPRELVGVGNLVELAIVDATGKPQILKFPKGCRLGYDPAHKATRLYCWLTDAKLAKNVRDYWDQGGPTYTLQELAQAAGGRQAKWKHKGPRVRPLGLVKHVVYSTAKKGDAKHRDAPDLYIHELGEESGVKPYIGVCSDGELWWAGGDYVVEPRGIVN